MFKGRFMSFGENPLRPVAKSPRRFFALRLPKLFSAPHEKKRNRHCARGRGVDQIALNFLQNSCLVFIVVTAVEQVTTPRKSRHQNSRISKSDHFVFIRQPGRHHRRH